MSHFFPLLLMEAIMKREMLRRVVSRTSFVFLATMFLLCESSSAQSLTAASEKEPLKRKAVELETQGDCAGALKILQSLTDQDYYVPAQDEMCYEIPGHISGERQLAMMRCHRILGNKNKASDIAWLVLVKKWDIDRQAVKLIAQETDAQGGVEAVRTRLRTQIKTSDYQPMAKEALAYLNILDAGKRHDYVAIQGVLVPWIKSAQWIHGHKWLQAEAIAQLDETFLRHALEDLESGDQKRRETGAIMLSIAPDGVLERADPKLKRTLAQYKIAINSTEDYKEGNMAVLLLRAIATSRNSDYITPLNTILGKELRANKFPQAQLVYTLGHLGDESVIPQLQKGLEEGKYSHFVLPALRALAKRPKASKKELLEWCRMKTTQQGDEGDELKPAP